MQVFCFNNRGERVYNEGKEFKELRIRFSKLTEPASSQLKIMIIPWKW